MSPASTILDLTALDKKGTPAAAPEQSEPNCGDTFKDLGDRFATACHLAVESCTGCVCMMCCPTKQRASGAWPLHEE